MNSTTDRFVTASDYASYPAGYWAPLSVAHEILNLAPIYAAPESTTAMLATYKGAGSNPIPSAIWDAGYVPPYPYIENTTRNLQFNESHFISSPYQPEGVTTYITTSDGYTWAALSTTVNAMNPFSLTDYAGHTPPVLNAYAAGNWVTDPVPGALKLTVNYKAQNMLFYADDPTTGEPIERFFVRDPYDNVYIMHASAATDPAGVESAFNAADFPTGWIKYSTYLPQDLEIQPAQGVGNLYEYTLLRDNADNTYHQMSWGNSGQITAQVPGMPIWGGQTDNVLYGTSGNDTIYAGGGNDVIAAGRGSDFIDGGAGTDTAVFEGMFKDYFISHLSNGQVTVQSLLTGDKDTLNSIENLKFDVSGLFSASDYATDSSNSTSLVDTFLPSPMNMDDFGYNGGGA